MGYWLSEVKRPRLTFSLPLGAVDFPFIVSARRRLHPAGDPSRVVADYEMLFYAIYACCIGLGRRHAGVLAIGTLVLIAIAGL